MTLFILFLSLNCFTQNDSLKNFSTGKFPEIWDTNRTLREDYKEVLIWLHQVDSRSLEVKYCVTLSVNEDSLGKTNYYLGLRHSNEKPFNMWHQSSIHFTEEAEDDSGDVSNIGYWDVHVRKYEKLPSEAEIYQLFDEWMFSLNEKGWTVLEFGIDKKLWMELFGFVPNSEFIIE